MSLLSARGSLLLVAFGVLLGSVACSGKDAPSKLGDDMMTPDESEQGPIAAPPSDDPCESGAVRKCVYYLPAHNGVHPCVRGLQSCDEGAWGDCIETATDGGTPPL